MKTETKKIIVFIVFLLLIALVAVVLFNIERIVSALTGNDGNNAPLVSGDIEKDMNTVYIDGEEYYRKKNVVNYLVMGIDSFGESDSGGVGQADFLTVISFDVVNKSYKLVPVNRDTMTEVRVFDKFENEVGKRVEQIALSHAYGSSLEVSNVKKCENTSYAVSNLLHGVEFKEYVSMTMDAVAKIVDILGGVDVFMYEDWTEIDPAYEKGATVCLNGNASLTFIRARGGIEDNSNISRMKRQNVFLEAFIKKIGDLSMNDEEMLEAYESVEPYLVSASGADSLLEIADKISSYDYDGTAELPGRAEVVDGYMEFYVDEKELKQLVTEIFFNKSEE